MDISESKCLMCDLLLALEKFPPYFCPNPCCGYQLNAVNHQTDVNSDATHQDDHKFGNVSKDFPKDDCWMCPRCKRFTDDFPALSRIDNETDVCSDCGHEEAMVDYYFLKLMKKVG